MYNSAAHISLRQGVQHYSTVTGELIPSLIPEPLQYHQSWDQSTRVIEMMVYAKKC